MLVLTPYLLLHWRRIELFPYCLQSDFRDYPELLRQAISLARRLQDPLVEFSQLCTTDEEILCLRYHSLQVKFYSMK